MNRLLIDLKLDCFCLVAFGTKVGVNEVGKVVRKNFCLPLSSCYIYVSAALTQAVMSVPGI